MRLIFWSLTWIQTNKVKINKVGSCGLETIMKSYCLPYLVNRSRIFHNCVSWYYWAVVGNLSQHEFEHVHFLFARETTGLWYTFVIVCKASEWCGFCFLLPPCSWYQKRGKVFVKWERVNQVLSPIFKCIHCFYFRQTPLFRGAGSARYYSTYCVQAATTVKRNNESLTLTADNHTRPRLNLITVWRSNYCCCRGSYHAATTPIRRERSQHV